MTKIGKITEVLSYTFEWEIHDYFSLLQRVNTIYESPEFEFADATWSLEINPKGTRDISKGWVFLYLTKVESKWSELVVNCMLSIKDKDGEKYEHLACTKNFDENVKICCWPLVVGRSQLVRDRWKVAPNGILIITCTLSCNWKSCASVTASPVPSKLAHQALAPTSIDDCKRTEKENPKPDDKKHDEKETLFKLKGLNKMSEDFKGLFLNECDCDVTLKVKDRDFRAHKLIIGARSPMFCSMFKHDTMERSSGVVDIKDCDPDTFQDFLLYIYSGKVDTLNTSNVLSLYTVADKYSVDDLKSECIMYMEKELSVDNFGDVIALAVRHNESSLIEIATSFFTKNIKDIIVTVKWQSFITENPIAANELNIKALNNFMPK